MYKIERRKELIQIIQEDNFVTIKKLAKIMYASEATIRRDLKALEQMNIVKRTYGGVTLVDYLNKSIPLHLREKTNKNAKITIAKNAARLIKDGNVIILDGSSTCLEIIQFLSDYSDLTIITNSARASEALDGLHMQVFCTGGLLTDSSLSYTGDYAENMIKNFNVDLLFFSSAGVTIDGRITDYSYGETQLRKVMLQYAKKTVFLCDSNKFPKQYCYNVCTLQDVDYVVSDQKFPFELQDKIHNFI